MTHTAEDERRAVVEWLRERMRESDRNHDDGGASMLEEFAHLIERGEHLRPTTSEQNDHEIG